MKDNPAPGPGVSGTVRIEMSLDETVCLYRFLADSDKKPDPGQARLICELRDFLYSRLSLREIEGVNGKLADLSGESFPPLTGQPGEEGSGQENMK